MTNVVKAQETAGTSGKTKMVAAVLTLTGAVLTLLAIIFPDALSAGLQAAVMAVVTAALGVWAAWKGEPGDVVVASFPYDPTPGLTHDPVAEPPEQGKEV